MKTTAASGYYLNLYKEWSFDILLIFNEANTTPTLAEHVALQYMIEESLPSLKGKDRKTASEVLSNLVNNSGFECVAYGV